MSWANWDTCDESTANAAWERLVDATPDALSDTSRVLARSTKLSFYASHLVIEFTYDGPRGSGLAYVLDGPAGTLWLDGRSDPIYAVNDAESLVLTDDTVHDYVRLFLFFLRADAEAFVLIESPDDLSFAPIRPSASNDAETRLAALRERVVPLTTREIDDDDRWIIDASVTHSGTFFATTFTVSSDGAIEMSDDEPIDSLDQLSVPRYPSLAIMRLPSDREITKAIVSVLLDEAVEDRDKDDAETNTLLHHFNGRTASDTPIDRLARFVARSRPVIVIESEIPFVEEFVADLIDGPDQAISGGAMRRATPVSGDEFRCEVAYGDTLAKMHLLSFHEFRSVASAERTANELALSDAAVLIGCDRLASVPEPLRRISDLTLKFPHIDARSFVRIFERVFQIAPNAGWDADGNGWTRDLVPADFHMPKKLSLEPQSALGFLKERAVARLREVTPDIGPSLSDLHGLGEARRVCEDLITDIRAAQAGDIPWTAVDKGVLLVGAPGTGKTTLARALAKECGIKFVIASAASWQAAGALDSHLQAMRADFAEARRYAPAILFIDEIDGIGSRERVDDRNALYQTEVINALLEQIQGIDTVDPVIVVAATNYPEKVDPALRRAGRLDQTVALPLPTIDGLEQIYTYYLTSYRHADQLDSDVNPRMLAELSLGLTGADVEFFVRGAFRRARRARRKQINQEDLVAEVTHRPRDSESAPRLSPDAIKRVATHEAGHAMSRLTSSSKGHDITFVTIIPRLDGSLGFVASVPVDQHVQTRHELVEQLETMLAGRAAEELLYGKDDVSTGAGGSDANSDLAVATRLATYMVCQAGLADDSGVRWTLEPSRSQQDEIDKLLRDAYANVLSRLEMQRALFDEIVELLVQKQEVSGSELRRLNPGRS